MCSAGWPGRHRGAASHASGDNGRAGRGSLEGQSRAAGARRRPISFSRNCLRHSTSKVAGRAASISLISGPDQRRSRRRRPDTRRQPRRTHRPRVAEYGDSRAARGSPCRFKSVGVPSTRCSATPDRSYWCRE